MCVWAHTRAPTDTCTCVHTCVHIYTCMHAGVTVHVSWSVKTSRRRSCCQVTPGTPGSSCSPQCCPPGGFGGAEGASRVLPHFGSGPFSCARTPPHTPAPITRWQFRPVPKWGTVGSLLPWLTSVLGGPVSPWVFSVALPMPWGCAFSLPLVAEALAEVLGVQRLSPSDLRTVLLGEAGLCRLLPEHCGSRSLLSL